MFKRRVVIMKKVKYLIITCLSIAILSYGVIAFANGGTSVESKDLSHGDVTGNFVAMIDGNSTIKLDLENGIATYPLDKSIWVFRDQKKTVLENLKPGDKIELILNSSKKVAYIKAFSEVYLKAEAAASPIPTATATAEPTPTITPEPTVAPTPTVKPEPSPAVTPQENKRIIIVKEDSRLVIEKKEYKYDKHGDDHHDWNDHDDNDDNNHDDDWNDHHDWNDHDEEED
jgi:hypothetical protein